MTVGSVLKVSLSSPILSTCDLEHHHRCPQEPTLLSSSVSAGLLTSKIIRILEDLLIGRLRALPHNDKYIWLQSIHIE